MSVELEFAAGVSLYGFFGVRDCRGDGSGVSVRAATFRFFHVEEGREHPRGYNHHYES